MSAERQAEGIEKAARKIFEYDAPSHAPEEWEPINEWAKVDYRHTAVAVITAYLEHAFPEVTSAEELDALPDGTIIRDADGEACQKDSDEEVHWWRMLGTEDGWRSEDIHLPARVIDWGHR